MLQPSELPGQGSFSLLLSIFFQSVLLMFNDAHEVLKTSSVVLPHLVHMKNTSGYAYMYICVYVQSHMHILWPTGLLLQIQAILRDYKFQTQNCLWNGLNLLTLPFLFSALTSVCISPKKVDGLEFIKYVENKTLGGKRVEGKLLETVALNQQSNIKYCLMLFEQKVIMQSKKYKTIQNKIKNI